MMLRKATSVRLVEKHGPVVAALFAISCVDYGNDHLGGGAAPYDGGAQAKVAQADIDAGEQIDVTPGEGAGVFIEYETGGTWHLFASCDTKVSNTQCEWDVVATVAAGEQIDSFSGDDLETNDAIIPIDEGIRLIATTGLDLDGFYFDAPPGSTVRFDVFLDGGPVPRFVNWVGGGALNRGAPTNPIDLEPSAP